MPPDVQGALTRKLGPLPAWGWGVAVGGAILIARLFRKPSGASVTAGTAPTSIGSGTMIGTGPDATTQANDPFSGPNSLIEQLQGQVTDLQNTIATQGTISQEQATQLTTLQAALKSAQDEVTTQGSTIAGLSGTIHTLTDFQTLQTKLSALMDQRASTLYYINKWLTNKNSAQDALAKCKTAACKSTQNKAIDTANTNVANYTKTLGQQNADIAALQKQINSLGTTS